MAEQTGGGIVISEGVFGCVVARRLKELLRLKKVTIFRILVG